MYMIRKACLLTALRTLQTTEFFLAGMIRTRPYLPFAMLSLICGFAIGYLLTQ